MSNSEFESYAKEGTLPDWFNSAVGPLTGGEHDAGKTERGISPSDFPIGSLESRTAARAELERRQEQSIQFVILEMSPRMKKRP